MDVVEDCCGKLSVEISREEMEVAAGEDAADERGSMSVLDEEASTGSRARIMGGWKKDPMSQQLESLPSWQQ